MNTTNTVLEYLYNTFNQTEWTGKLDEQNRPHGAGIFVDKKEQYIMLATWEHGRQVGPGFVCQFPLKFLKYTWQHYEGDKRVEKVFTFFVINKYFGDSYDTY